MKSFIPNPFCFACIVEISFFFQVEKSNKSEQAGERRSAPIVSKNGELGGEGVSKKREEGRVPCLTPSPCSLVFALARSFVHFACYFGHACYACYTVFIVSHLNFITEITRQEAACILPNQLWCHILNFAGFPSNFSLQISCTTSIHGRESIHTLDRPRTIPLRHLG